jgi:hypothetical protein
MRSRRARSPLGKLGWVGFVLALGVVRPAHPIVAAATAPPSLILENAELHTVVEEIAKIT